VLSAAFGLAVRHDELAANPVRNAAHVARQPVAVQALTMDEVAGLRAAVKRWQDGCNPVTGEPELALGGGLRATDALDVADMLAASGARRPRRRATGTLRHTSVTKAHYIQKAHTAPDVSDMLEQLGPSL